MSSSHSELPGGFIFPPCLSRWKATFPGGRQVEISFSTRKFHKPGFGHLLRSRLRARLVVHSNAEIQAICYDASFNAEIEVRSRLRALLLPVSVKNIPYAQALALQPSSRNCSPAPDSVLRKLIFQCLYYCSEEIIIIITVSITMITSGRLLR